MKTLVDQGSSVVILFWETFQKLNQREKKYDTIPRTNN